MKVKSILAVAAFAPLAAFSSVLVYDGFDTDADYAGLAAGGTSIYSGGYPKARNQIVGYGASAKWGGETDNLRQAALSVEGVAKVVLTRTLRMRGLTMASGTALDLAGRCLTVGEAFVNGTKLPDGTYNSNSTFDVGGGKALADFLSGEGTLVVRRPKGLALILK